MSSCDKFEPQDNLGVLVKLTNQQKPLIEKQFTHTNVNRTRLFLNLQHKNMLL